MVIIHEEYIGRVAEKNIVNRHIVTEDEYRNMTSDVWKRIFKAREYRENTLLGYTPVRWTKRRWGDNKKFIDLWHIMKKLPVDFVAVRKEF